MSQNENRKVKKEHSEAREWIQSIIIAVVLAFVIKMFLFDFVLVQGSSMHPTLENGDRLIINKIEYRLGEPDYGDIVILNYSSSVEYVKRVIAKGGDNIAIKDQVVYVNGEPIDEPYVNTDPYGDFPEVTVPEGTYFVMGDNGPTAPTAASQAWALWTARTSWATCSLGSGPLTSLDR